MVPCGTEALMFGKLVSAAGVAPAITPAQAEHVAATLRAVCPGAIRKGAGGFVFVGSESLRPWTATRGEIQWPWHSFAMAEIQRAGSASVRAPGPAVQIKIDYLLVILRPQPAVSRRLFRCFGHTSSEALKL